MPQFRKLLPAEIRTLEYTGSTKRQRQEEQYDLLLEDFQSGDYGEVEVEDGETRVTVRRRLRVAAQRRGLTLTFLRPRGGIIRFRVEVGQLAGGASVADS